MSLRIAILLTAYNRKEQTLTCLANINSQVLPSEISYYIYLTDDASTDGTTRAVLESFPEVHILQGNGALFWNGGMYVAFEAAMSQGYDYYLWLNDDTHLKQNALHNLVATAESLEVPGIIVGSAQDPLTGSHTYGGVVRSSSWHPLKFSTVLPGETLIPCDTMNGNCVLIPHKLAMALGNLDPAFRHGIGDFDYGLRARKNGYDIWVMPGYVGTCQRNKPAGTSRDASLPLCKRFRMLMGPKELPLSSWIRFTRRYAGVGWPLFFLMPYVHLVFVSFILKFAGILGKRKESKGVF